MRISRTLSNTFSITIARFGASMMGAITTIFLARELGPSNYGLLSIALSLFAIFLLIADFGISTSTARYVAKTKSEGKNIFPVLRDGFVLKVIFVFFSILLILFFSKVISNVYRKPELSVLLKFGMLYILFSTFFLFIGRMFQAVRNLEIYALSILVQGAAVMGLTIYLVKMGNGVRGALIGYIGGTIIGTLLLTTFIVLYLLKIRPWNHACKYTKIIARYSIPLAAISFSYFAFSHINNIMLGYFGSEEDVGYYNITFRIINFLRYPFFAFGMSISPLFAKDSKRNYKMASTFVKIFKYTIVLVLPLFAGLMVLSPVAIRIFLGESYSNSIRILSAQGPFFLLSSLIFVFGPILSFAGYAKIRAYVFAGCAFIAIVLNLILIPPFGSIGAVISITIAFAIYTIAILIICRNVYSFRWTMLCKIAWRPFLATVIMTGVLLWLVCFISNIFELISLVLFSCIIYTGVIFATRTVTINELKSITLK